MSTSNHLLHHLYHRTALPLQAFKPDLLISAGTAGGFTAQGGAIGDVYISKAVMHHDRRIPIPVGAQRCSAVPPSRATCSSCPTSVPGYPFIPNSAQRCNAVSPSSRATCSNCTTIVLWLCQGC
jgi:Phosphorylase superfamily